MTSAVLRLARAAGWVCACVMVAACGAGGGGGSSSASASSGTVQGVATPSQISVVTAVQQ